MCEQKYKTRRNWQGICRSGVDGLADDDPGTTVSAARTVDIEDQHLASLVWPVGPGPGPRPGPLLDFGQDAKPGLLRSLVKIEIREEWIRIREVDNDQGTATGWRSLELDSKQM